MNTALETRPSRGTRELGPDEARSVVGGSTIPPWVVRGGIVIGGYLAKAAGDNWGSFKKGVVSGYRWATQLL